MSLIFAEKYQIIPKIIDYLIIIFYKINYYRFDPDNYILILVINSEFKNILKISSIKQNLFKSFLINKSFYYFKIPEIIFILYIYKYYRIEILKRILKGEDR